MRNRLGRFLLTGILVLASILFSIPPLGASDPLPPPTPQPEDNPAPTVQPHDPPTTSTRPMIGLVLGGGGARGPAHIGVLKVLRDLRVPIDYVSGTSMGAVIGALFALGHDPERIEELILNVDWDELFSDPPDRLERTYRRKQDDNSKFLPVEFGFRDFTLLTNRGLIAGQKLGFVFPDPNLYVAGYRGFDHLAYPFRCVGTDLHSGEAVVLDRGNLLQAVRASMSIPGLFPPVPWNGRTLIDGGVVKNLPVDVVRDMGADFIIAVDVGVLPEETEEKDLGSIYGILSQTLSIQGRRNVLAQMELADLVIQVPLGDHSFKDFKNVGFTIEPGRQAALAVADELRALSVGEQEYRAHQQAHRLPDRGMPVIDDITLLNMSPASDDAIRRVLGQQTGRPLDLARLKLDLATIYDFGVFELVDFTVTNKAERNALTVQANGSAYAPHVFKVGLAFIGGQEGKSDLAARMRHTWLEMNRFGGEWRNDLLAGRISLFETEWYQPFTWSRVPFFALGGRSQYSVLDYFDETGRRGEYNLAENTAILDLGGRLGKWGEVRAGMEYGFLKTTNRSGLGLEDFRGQRGGWTARLGVDQLDDPVFPRHGFATAAEVFMGRGYFGNGLHYTRLEGDLRLVDTIAGNTFTLGLAGGSDFDTDLPVFDEFTAGGLNRLSGYLDAELRGSTYGIASLGWYREIHSSPGLFSTSYLVGLGIESGNVWSRHEIVHWDELRYCLNVSLMARTALGPIVLAYGRAEDGDDAVYLNMGAWFDFTR